MSAAGTSVGDVTVHRLSRRRARQIAVRAQRFLDSDRPTGWASLVEHLTGVLPIDRTSAVAPSPDLVAWSRMGTAYDAEDLVEALAVRDLYDNATAIRPMPDLRLQLAEEMSDWPPWDGA